MIAASSSASRATLHEAPARLLRFLDGVADPAISAELAAAGLTDADVDQAYALFDALRRHTHVVPLTPNPIAVAMAECERWQAVDFVRLRAVWSLEHREDAATIFGNLEPGCGAMAVANASIFLERWKDREHPIMTRDALAKLRKNVTIVQTNTAPYGQDDEAERRRAREAIKRRMHAWVTAWAAVARTTITRRDHMIRLGIASRRAGD